VNSCTSNELRVTILGSGSSGGVPRFGGEDGSGDWGACDPEEPKNRRTRCSLLVQKRHAEKDFDHSAMTSVLVDTSPDMRQQLLAARCSRLDAVVYTHDHADQAHGVDDLRVFALSQQQKIPVYIDPDTSGELLRRFHYCFEQKEGSFYPPILDNRKMPRCGAKFAVAGPSGAISIIPFIQNHGSVDSLGFRFGDIAYSSDVVDLPEESFDILAGVNTWIIDALQYEPHATHAHLDLALKWIEKVNPKHAILTNLHVYMDYQTLRKQLPAHIEPAFDGMTVSATV